MNAGHAKRVIVEECLKPGGFAFSIRENRVDVQGFSRLLEAVREISRDVASEDVSDRIVIACLFELPWGIENTVDHYSKQSLELGVTASKMAEELRDAIHELLWSGLESYYDNPSKE